MNTGSRVIGMTPGGCAGVTNVVLAICLCVGFTAHTRAQVTNATAIESITQLYALAGQMTTEGTSVRVKGIITYSDPELMWFCIQDGSKGLLVQPESSQMSYPVGQKMDVKGRVAWEGNLACLSNATWESKGSASVPNVLTVFRVSATALASNACEGRWIEVTGRVESASMAQGRLELGLNCDGVPLNALVRWVPPTDLEQRWTGDRVRVKGVWVPRFSTDGPAKPRFYVNTLADVKRIVPAVPGPFDLPLSSLTNLAKAGDALPNRVKVRGRVAGLTNASWQMKDGSAAALVGKRPPAFARAGDVVEAAGAPLRERGKLTLSNATCRLLGTNMSAIGSVSLDSTNWVPLLTTARAVHGLNEGEATNGLPARVRGVVMYTNPKSPRRICVQDETGGMWVSLERGGNALPINTLVEVDGFTSGKAFKPELQRGRVTVQGSGRLPMGRNLALTELASGRHDSQWVELQGIVREARVDRELLILQVAGGGGKFRVEIPAITNVAQGDSLVDAEVRVRGVCFNTTNRQGKLTGFKLLTPNLTQVVLQKAAPEKPFEGPEVPVASLLKRDLREFSGHRVLVRGMVGRFISSNEMCLKDGGGALYVQLAWTNGVRPGDVVDVLGFPAAGGRVAPVLQDPVLRVPSPLRHEAPPQPVDTGLDQLQTGALDAHLVRIKGRLIEHHLGLNRFSLTLRLGEHTVGAESRWQAGVTPPSLENGSEVEVTGICQNQADDQGHPISSKLLITSPADIKVLSAPPWWDLSRVLTVLGIAATLVCGALGWVWLLRRQVSKQTAVIQDRFERERVFETRYRDLFQNANDIVYTLDLQGHLTSLNPAGERILGCRAGNGDKPKLAELVKPEHQPRLAQLLARKPEDTTSPCELDLQTKEGRVVKLEMNSRVLVENGQVVGVQGIARDVTERIALEEQLRQAIKLESVGRLAGGVAHDFNNILTIIGGHASLMMEEKNLDHRLRASVTEMAAAAERAARLTRQLLTFSRRQPMQMRTLDLNGIISDISRLLRRLLGEHIELQVNYDPGPLKVCGDASMIEQVILNLAVNARDAIEGSKANGTPGRVGISTTLARLHANEIRHHPHRRAGDFACLRVADNRCGMDAETIRNIFEPFYTTKEVGKGTGLGLATVYGVVQQHGGWIEVESAVGQGATFLVYLPLDTRPSSASEETTAGPVRGGKETVLVVEDELSVRMLAHRALTQLGYQVVVAESGAKALKMWEEVGPKVDLLFTDIVMPEGVSGFDLAERLQKEKPGLKVVYTSGYSMEAAERRVTKGMNLLPKPFSIRSLGETVRSCLDAR